MLINLPFQQQLLLIPDDILQDDLRIDKYIPKSTLAHLLLLHPVDLPDLPEGRSSKLQIEYLHIDPSEKDLAYSDEIGLWVWIQDVVVPAFGEELRTA